MKTQYTLLSGETVEFSAPTGDLATFLRRVMAAAKEPGITDRDLSELVFGPNNPLLDKTVLQGRAIATVETYRNPIFHVMLDCVARKTIPGSTSVSAVRARYTVTVPEAAKQLGISESAVRQAIYSSRLRARKDGGTYYLDPQSVTGYRVSRRGPRRREDSPRGLAGAALEAKIGSTTDVSFRIQTKLQSPELDTTPGGERTGTIPSGWHRIAILGICKDRATFWEIEPADGESVLHFEGFYLRGGFRIIETISNTPKAKSSFKNYVPK